MPQDAQRPDAPDTRRLRQRIVQMKMDGRDTAELERQVIRLEYDVESLEHVADDELPGAVADVDEPTPLEFAVMQAVKLQAERRQDRALILSGVQRDAQDARIYAVLGALYGAAHVVVALLMAFISYRVSTLLAEGLIALVRAM